MIRSEVILMFFMVSILSSCYEPRTGCLDPFAVNYDVSADINEGCEYPSLSLNIAHMWGDENFSYDSVYLDASGQPFMIKFMGFFMKAPQVLTEAQGFVPVSDKTNSVRLLSGENILYNEEIVFVEDRNFQSVIDSVTVFDPWSELKAQLGLGVLSTVDSSSLRSGHPLNQRNAMSPSGSAIYFDLVISIIPDTSDEDSRKWIYSKLPDSFQISFSKDTVFTPAMDASLIFDLQYEELFNDYRIEMSDTDILEMWKNNIRSSFTIRQ